MLRTWWWAGVLAMALPAIAASQPQASLQPLSAYDAAILRDGLGEITLAADYARNERFPFFTAPGALRRQDRSQVPRIGFRAGAADWVEIEAEYEAIYLDERTAQGQTNWQYGSGDARLHTKVRVRPEDPVWPALAVRFGTKLPNANKDDRLGTDETDFDILALISKDVGAVRVHTNLGIALLGNPGQMLGHRFGPGGQDDLFVYAVAMEGPSWKSEAQGGAQIRLLGEISGLTGSRFDNDRTRAAAGIRLHDGPLAFFLGASFGLDTGSEDFGLKLGMNYVWDLGAWVDKIQ
ncbi:MAG: hypothetical protein KatS3mg077_1345 [Candidatus Binatia bacterium]|nr:MAG: hypothetical protein KatS3mg077_1345 [Candidatus Binatia bacterium]